MEISVIICTHNRAGFLQRCLQATLDQIGAKNWDGEIVVIANACTDQTRAVVSALAAANAGRLRCVDEAQLGLSHARNTAVAVAGGRTLFFLDDDALPAPGALASLAEYAAAHPEVHAGGGPIELDWGTTPKPPYWQTQFDSNLGRLVFDPAPDFFPPGQFPFGGNMFIRAKAFQVVGNFDPALGMLGRRVSLGEETDWFLRYAAAGGQIGYLPNLLVRHWVNPERLTRRSLWRRSWRAGIAAAALHGAPPETRGLARWTRHCLAGAVSRRLVLAEQLYLLRWLGQLWGQRHDPRPPRH